MIIVTGGAGLIGSAVVWGLNRRGIDDILVVDHLGTSDKWKNLAPLRFRDYQEKDRFLGLLDSPSLSGEISAIIHLGACSSTLERDATYLVANNVEYSKRLARFALERNIRFIYASSAATYGDGQEGFSDDDGSIGRLRPLNPYGYSKQMFDLWLLQNGYLPRVVGLKYFNVYGPNEHHKGEMRSVVHKAFQQIREQGEMTLFRSHRPDYADGEQLRDFVYVKDAVEMTLFFLFEGRDAGGVFNIGTGTPRSWNDLGRALFAALGIPPRIRYVDMPEGIRDRYQYYTCADVSKLRRAGFSGRCHTLEEAIADYVQSYLLAGKFLGDEKG
ncbi:MAG: ADP-glyceromanno-heptose 6-epimerase [Desulfuromonadia bacterium]